MYSRRVRIMCWVRAEPNSDDALSQCEEGTRRSVGLEQRAGGPRIVVSTAAFHARVRGSLPGLGGLKETKIVSSPSTCESQYCGEPP